MTSLTNVWGAEAPASDFQGRTAPLAGGIGTDRLMENSGAQAHATEVGGAAAEAALQAMPIGVLVEDGRGTCWINDELARIWGRNSADSVASGDFQRDLAPRTRAAKGGDPWHTLAGAGATDRWRRYVLRRGNGTAVPVRVSRRAIPHSPGETDEATFVMEEPREGDARLRQAFLAMVGHELRTPISSVVAGAELLHGRHLDVKTHEEVAGLVVEEANRIAILVEQVTSLTLLQSAGSALASEPVHVIHLARKVGVREARRRPGLELRLPALEPDAAIALGDEGFVDQVLTILIDNAAKYAGATGIVEVVVGQSGGEVTVHVLDRGPGLRGADPERLFELFERAGRTMDEAGGTGIGLYVARQIVHAMGGRVWAADRVDGGADFGFALPVAT